MAPPRAAVVTVALLAWSIGSGVTEAADRCLSRSEARALWPRTHLYWSSQGGTRCWSNVRGKRGRFAERPKPVPPQKPMPPPMPPPFPPVPPTTIAGLMPVMQIEPSLIDYPPWYWVEDARAEATGVVFSTFPHGEPDVWPRLEPASNTAGLIIVLVAGELALLFGLLLWRWQLNRLRISMENA